MKKQIFKKSTVKKAMLYSLVGGVTDPNEDDDFTRDKKNPITPSQPSTPSQPGTPTTSETSDPVDY